MVVEVEKRAAWSRTVERSRGIRVGRQRKPRNVDRPVPHWNLEVHCLDKEH